MVELMGFEPLTSSVKARAVSAPSLPGSRMASADGLPLDPA
jgi:hypothetical protein